MNNLDIKKHWEKVYQNNELKDASWHQSKPKTSIDFFKEFKISRRAKIIDIGGGDSYLVDNLLDLGYKNITVLDISETAIEKAKKRLGKRSLKVKWILADISNFKTKKKYDFWHDRATFHFLTTESDIYNYISTSQKSITNKGVLVIGTFSEQGPKKCSGIAIKQYSELSMTNKLNQFFEKIKCITVDHKTPFDTIQNFVFCSFKKKI
ncbi:MAG: class I SAM-dependent methyltransferase [Cyanobacteriota bacterium]